MAINSILSFSTKPINFISTMGLVISFLSFGYLFFVIYEKLFVTGYSGFGFGTLTNDSFFQWNSVAIYWNHWFIY